MGDILAYVNDVNVLTMNDSMLAKIIIGPEGSKVTLGFLRDDDRRIRLVTLERAINKKQEKYVLGKYGAETGPSPRNSATFIRPGSGLTPRRGSLGGNK